jgi:nitrogen regulatory protein PII
MTVVTGAGWEEAKWYLRKKMYIDVPDTGISFIIPMSSIGGKRELAFLTAGQNYRKGEESVMKDTTMELLVVVSNQGHNDLVMDAARGAGAYGGTVIHARGTGMNQAELFFGVSLASEKDLTFIVTKKNQRNAIMSAIMKEAGMDTPAQSIVFSLPVTDAVGLNTGGEDTK